MIAIDPAHIASIHEPVLLDRCVALLAPALERDGALYVDATTGMAGHAVAVLTAAPRARMIGLDRDTEALSLAATRLAAFGARVHLVHAVYDRIGDIVDDQGSSAQAILFDLGVSSLQLDERARGFSYSADAPLDMRMDATNGQTAADLLNTVDGRELVRIFREYGEEPYSVPIARAIVRRRERRPFARTGELVETIESVVPVYGKRRKGHPAKRVFQALRIEVNGELAALEAALPAAIDALGEGGRIVVLAYHSLEDRLVKRAFAAAAASSTPQGLPVELPGHGPTLRLLTRGAERAGADEIGRNPRAGSVRLRAAEKLGAEA